MLVQCIETEKAAPFFTGQMKKLPQKSETGKFVGSPDSRI